MQPDTPAQIIARVPKNRQESVVVALDAFKGVNLVDGQGQDRPTTKGICLNVERLPELRAAVVAAEEEAVRRGLLPAGGVA